MKKQNANNGSYTYVATCHQEASRDGRVLGLEPGDLVSADNPPLFDSPTIVGQSERTGETGLFPSSCLVRCIRAQLVSGLNELPAGTEVLIKDLRMQQPGCSFYCGQSLFTRPIELFYFGSTEELAAAVRPYTADPKRGDELTLEMGRIVRILHKRTIDADWWLGEIDGQAGVFPSNYVWPLKQVMSLLAQLAMQGEFEKVRMLTTNELMRIRGANGRTVLMLAAEFDSGLHLKNAAASKCVNYFMRNGCNPGAADSEGNTAAHLAAKCDHLQLLALLPFDAKWLQNNSGRTPLMEAALAGSWRCAKHLLHLLRQCRFLEFKGTLLSTRACDGRTALDMAKETKKNEIAEIIEIETGLTIPTPGTIFLQHILEDARKRLVRFAESSQVGDLKQLLTISNTDLPDRNGATALWKFADSNRSSRHVLQALISQGDPTSADVWGSSCLHAAAKSGNSVALKALLGVGVDVNSRTEDGLTPLMQVAISDICNDCMSKKTAHSLLQAGADWSLKNNAGLTALQLAEKNKKKKLVELLTQYDAKEFFEAGEQPEGGFLPTSFDFEPENLKSTANTPVLLRLEATRQPPKVTRSQVSEGEMPRSPVPARREVKRQMSELLRPSDTLGSALHTNLSLQRSSVGTEGSLSSSFSHLSANRMLQPDTVSGLRSAAEAQSTDFSAKPSINLLVNESENAGTATSPSDNVQQSDVSDCYSPSEVRSHRGPSVEPSICLQAGVNSPQQETFAVDASCIENKDANSASTNDSPDCDPEDKCFEELAPETAIQDMSLHTEKIHTKLASQSDLLIRHPLFIKAKRDNEDEHAKEQTAEISAADIQRLCDEGKAAQSVNDLNETPLILLAKSGDPQLLRTLITNGATINERDTRGRTPIAVASRYGNDQALKVFLELISSQGGSAVAEEVNAADNSLETPVMHAAANDHPSTIRLLYSMGADLEKKDRCLQTALTHAAIRGSESCVTLLLSLGAEPHTLDYCGNTPLIWAARQNHSCVIVALSPALDKPEHWSHPGDYRMTALQCAEFLGNAAAAESIKQCIRRHQLDASSESTAAAGDESLQLQPWSEALEVGTGQPLHPSQLLDPLAGEDLRYSMLSRTRGVAIVINNIDFKGPELNRRDGAKADTHETGLYQAFKRLGLQVEIHENTTSHFLSKHLPSLNRPVSDYAQHDAFLLCVMSHGQYGWVYGSDDERAGLESLFRQVRECPGLSGKPKIFVIQACREAGPHLEPRSCLQGLEDCLYIYSTSEGLKSERCPTNGGIFSQALRDAILEADLRSVEFTQLLPKIAGRVFRETDGRQVVESVTTLRKPLYFPFAN